MERHYVSSALRAAEYALLSFDSQRYGVLKGGHQQDLESARIYQGHALKIIDTTFPLGMRLADLNLLESVEQTTAYRGIAKYLR